MVSTLVVNFETYSHYLIILYIVFSNYLLRNVASLEIYLLSSFSLQLCAATQIPEVLGGLDAEALYIDTNTNFTICRYKGNFKMYECPFPSIWLARFSEFWDKST